MDGPAGGSWCRSRGHGGWYSTIMISWNEYLFAHADQDHDNANIPIGIQLLMGQHLNGARR